MPDPVSPGSAPLPPRPRAGAPDRPPAAPVRTPDASNTSSTHARSITASPLYDPKLLARLEQLRLLTRRAHDGARKGERRSLKRGSSQEFADYRNYVIGDDLRFVDWNLYGRLDKLFIKLFLEEEDLTLAIVVDTSASMGFGEPLTKLDLARRLALSLGYIALANQEKVALMGGGNHVDHLDAGVRGRSALFPLIRGLESLTPKGPTELDRLLNHANEILKRSGVVLVCTDLLDPTLAEKGLLSLRQRGHEVVLAHLLTPDELHPTLDGDLALVDAETGETLEVTLSPSTRASYMNALQQYLDNAAGFCRRHGLGYLLWDGTTAIDDIVTRVLRQRGILR